MVSMSPSPPITQPATNPQQPLRVLNIPLSAYLHLTMCTLALHRNYTWGLWSASFRIGRCRVEGHQSSRYYGGLCTVRCAVSCCWKFVCIALSGPSL